MNHDKQSHLIQISLLKWISLLTTKHITTFQQLTIGQFYLELLACAKQFKFIKPLKNLSYEPDNTFTLANKISNIKIIGDSVIRYYQIKLMRDVSQMKINYVQLCMGNCQEGIKLFSLVVGIFVNQQEGQVYDNFYNALQKLEQDDQYIVKALLQNTKTIGQSVIKNQDSPLQRKILTKLETYEQKIENLQHQNEYLRIQLQEQKQMRQLVQDDLKQLKLQKSKLLQKSQVLELLNNRLQSQNSSFMMQNENLVKKLQSHKRHYDQQLIRNQQKLSIYQKQIKLIDSMKGKIDELKLVNSELKQQLTLKINEYKSEQQKFKIMKQNYKLLQQNLSKTQSKLSSLQLQYQQLQYKYQYDSSIKKRNKLHDSPVYHFSNNSQISQLKYRMKDRLQSGMKGQLSQFQMGSSNMIRRSSKQKGRYKGQNQFNDSGIINGKNLMGSICQYNMSNFVINQIGNCNIKNIEDVSQFGQQERDNLMVENEQLDKSIIVEEQQIGNNKNIEVNKRQKDNNNQQKIRQYANNDNNENRRQIIQQVRMQYKQQIQLMISIINSLYDSNEYLKKQLGKYTISRKKNQQRIQQFKKKLSKIRQMQSISSNHNNNKLQLNKQNINTNSYKLNNQLSKFKYNNQNQQQQNNFTSSNQIYPYYQITLN